MTALRYAPDIFDTASIPAAKAIILFPEQGLTPEQRWALETDWLMERIEFPGDATVIDYGCGIGRIAKRLPNPVVGVDISPKMREMAPGYVGRENFNIVSPLDFRRVTTKGFRAQGLVAVWVLQHIPSLDRTVDLIVAALDPGATLWVANRDNRSIPVSDGKAYGWVPDDADVTATLAKHFRLEHSEPIPDSLCTPGATLTRWRA